MIDRVRARAPEGILIEVEVASLAEFDDALAATPDIIMLDNMSLEDMTEAASRRDRIASDCILEASGGITAETIESIAATGVDRISIGALTHSVRAADIALEIEMTQEP